MGVMSFLYQMTRITESLATGGARSHGRRAVPFTTALTSAMGPAIKKRKLSEVRFTVHSLLRLSNDILYTIWLI